MRKAIRENPGFGMIEIVVGVSIISFALFGLATVGQISIRLSEESSNNTRTAFLLEEGVEAVKIMRDTSWQNISALADGNDHYLNFNGTTWATTTADTFVDGLFERKFKLSGVNRDASSQEIVASGGVSDSGTKKLDVSVSWRSQTGTTTKTISTYITNLF